MGRARAKTLVCPVERCGAAFYPYASGDALTHMNAPHAVCSCGWVGPNFAHHQGHTKIAVELHRRVAVVTAKPERVNAVLVPKVVPLEKGRAQKSRAARKQHAPERPTYDDAWLLLSRLPNVTLGKIAHELADWLRENDPMPRAWNA